MRLFAFIIAVLQFQIACSPTLHQATTISTQNIINCSASLGIIGDAADVQTKTESGLLLAGGSTDVDAAMQWLLECSGGGDVVIIRSSGSTGYNEYLFKLAKVNSVETLLINNRAMAENDTVAQIVRNAEALFIAGGDQWNYTQYWMGTKLNEAMNYLINHKKVPVGGTSAGLAIMGEYFFDAKNSGITSDSALQNPFNSKMSVNRGLIQTKHLTNLITDSHYDQRNRQGRHVVMLAHIQAVTHKPVRGLGIDEKTAVAIDQKGNMKVFGSNKAWFLQSGKSKPETFIAGLPFSWYAKERAITSYIVSGSVNGTNAGNVKRFHKLTGGNAGYLYAEKGILKPK